MPLDIASVNFNPRSDERSDGVQPLRWLHATISIHAPTNGATIYYVLSNLTHQFQSTLRRTERHAKLMLLCLPLTISIHAPTNGATKMTIINKNPRYISIHAPTNGATRQPMYKGYGCRHFNPRSDERSDSDSVIDPQSTVVFQSTLRRTERPQLLAAVTFSAIISIHAPTNGATNSVAVPLCDDTISIHAPTNGATST